MKKVLVFSVLLLILFVYSANNVTYGKEKIYLNELGVEFTLKELRHLEKLEITSLEIEVMTLSEKVKYLEFLDKIIAKQSYFLKTQKVKHQDGSITYDEVEISEAEAETMRSDENSMIMIAGSGCSIDPSFCLDDGGGGSSTWGDTYETNDNTDISVRKLTLISVYNYYYNQMFVKATVEWFVVPADRGWDLIGLGYTANEWYIETTNTYNQSTQSYIQTANFSGKQIYEWQEFDGQYSNPIISSETKSINYSEANIGYYTPDYTNGIVLKQNLKNDEIDFRSTTYGIESYGFMVTGLVMTLEAYIDNVGDNDYGIFKASSLHQESYTTINMGDCSFTYLPPYISVPLEVFQWGTKYEDYGLNVSINVPIN